ncbi:Uncharacterised protein [Mycobacteroides abscessus subsp. abscessus]|nr:Uncharacterised protein [Mycobacteroides abscessus subsp. abscessus]
MTVLDGDLLRDELLGVQHGTDTQRQHRQAQGQTVERSRQVVERVARIAEGLVLPGPEQEDPEQGQAEHATECEPQRHQTLGTLLGLGALDGPARLAVDNLDAVEVGAELDQLVTAHGRELLVARDLWLVSVTHAHARAPIHSAAAMAATMPMIHMAMPSDVGPKPPRP